MNKLTALLALGLLSTLACAQSSHYVRPHVTRNGTYVEGHYQTNPDSSRLNNWSTQGNINPYTGRTGTVNPYSTPQPTYTPPPVRSPYTQQCGYSSTGRYVCR